MEHNADTDWFIRENLELHRQLRSTMAFLEKCYHSNRGAKGITAPTEQEWQDIFDMLCDARPRKNINANGSASEIEINPRFARANFVNVHR